MLERMMDMKKDYTKLMKSICIIGYVLVVAMVCYIAIFHKIKVDFIPFFTFISSMTILELMCIYRYGGNANKEIQVWLPIMMILTFICMIIIILIP